MTTQSVAVARVGALLQETRSNTKRIAKRRLERNRFVNVALDRTDRDADATAQQLGVRMPGDAYAGDTRLRTLNALLSTIDQSGFERSIHQLEFHSAFTRCVARSLFREDFATHAPDIMKRQGWTTTSSEVLISTPRRFGKTFSIAMFVAALALAARCEIVIFSPARRASRKLLERIVEFVRLVNCENKITEFNQEQLRVNTMEGTSSLVRSFPSKVGVCCCELTEYGGQLARMRAQYHNMPRAKDKSGKAAQSRGVARCVWRAIVMRDVHTKI